MTSTTACTPPRRSTLSIKEFSHLISESLDMSPYSSPYNLEKLGKESSEKRKSSPFQRVFLRPSLVSTSAGDQDTSATPRRIGFPWPFSRGSPSKRSFHYEPNGPDMSNEQKTSGPCRYIGGLQGIPLRSLFESLVAGSTSSLGSLIPANELPTAHSGNPLHLPSPSLDQTRQRVLRIMSPPQLLQSLYGNKSSSASISSSGTEVVEIGIAISSEDYVRNGTDVPSPSTRSESESEDDPTPRASTFSSGVIAPASPNVGDPLTLTQRRRLQALSLILPPHGVQLNEIPDQETDATSVSSCTPIAQPIPMTPMQNPVPIVLTTPPSDTTPVIFRGVTTRMSPSLSRPPSSQGSLNSAYSGGGRARSTSRGTRSPPPLLPGPPPSGPLPAVPAVEPLKSPVPQVFLSSPEVSVPVSASSPMSSQLSLFPPVPPLPPALKSKQSILAMQLPLPNSGSSSTAVTNKLQPQGQMQQIQGRAQSPSRSPSKQTQFQTQSPPGALRLPSRMCGGAVYDPDGSAPSNSGPGLLPSPPATPTRVIKRASAPGSSSKIGPCMSSELTTDTPGLAPPRSLRRPTSLGVGILEAASVAAAVGNTTVDGHSAQGSVRRTKSILLLGSRSKFAFPFGSGSSGTSRNTTTGAGMQKRVQIRAESGDGQDEAETDGRHGYGCVGVGIGAVIGGEKEVKEKDANAVKKGRRRSALGLKNISLGIGRDKDKERDRDKNKEAARAKRTSDPTPTLVPPSTTSTSAPMSAPSDPVAPQILVLRERRHSAPILSRMRSRTRSRLAMNGDATQENTNTQREPSMDWTLSLPLSTDVPGNRISPLVKGAVNGAEGQGSGESEVEEEEKEDWTLCMPLRARIEVAIVLPGIRSGRGVSGVSRGRRRGRSQPKDAYLSEKCIDIREQLPTPSPSPTPSSPLLLPGPYVHVHGQGTELEHGIRARTMHDSDGGLDIDSGRGKRGSGWNALGWFGDAIPESVEEMEEEPQQPIPRHLSTDSTATVASTTTETTIYYSARSSCYSRHSPLNTDFLRLI
ncbi:hypothetical protein BKA82DRAFT_4085080 [Pisolithus tinctorius]|nr:hypothetical protein BKA82DRAFT_4085080 [Pisolithus tinctorius]